MTEISKVKGQLFDKLCVCGLIHDNTNGLSKYILCTVTLCIIAHIKLLIIQYLIQDYYPIHCFNDCCYRD